MTIPVEVSSYLIRLWREIAPSAPAPEWHCDIEHLQSGQHWSFETAAALLAFMAAQTQHPPAEVEPAR